MLTDLKLKNIKFSDKVTLHYDRDGLYLRVSKTKKRWQLSFMKDGKLRHFYAEKEYPLMSLAEARKWAADTRNMSESTQLTSVSELSFERFVTTYRNKLLRDNRSPSTLKKFDLRINKYLKDFFQRDVRGISPQELLAALRSIETRGKHEALRQTLQLTYNIFLMAKIEGVIQSNPCEGLRLALSSKDATSRASITDIYEFGKLLNSIDSLVSSPQVKIALQLSPLLFTRPAELRFARWSEFDLKDGFWTIPGERMKMGDDLIVPLSTQVMALFWEIKKITGVCELVFDMGRGSAFSDVTLRKALAGLGYFGAHQGAETLPSNAKFHSPHGFRASFRTIADEVLEWRIDVIEQQLAHLVRDTNGRAYNRTKHLQKRVQMMQLWADFCDTLKTGERDVIESHIEKLNGLI